MNAVNLPGSLYFSAASTVSFQAAAYGADAGPVHQLVGKRTAGKVVDELQRSRVVLPGLDHVVPLLAQRLVEKLGLAGDQVGGESHVVGVVGDHQEIERARQLRLLFAGGHHLFAAREAVGVFDTEAVAEQPGIHRHGGVQVRVAEEHLRRATGGRRGRRRGRISSGGGSSSLREHPAMRAEAAAINDGSREPRKLHEESPMFVIRLKSRARVPRACKTLGPWLRARATRHCCT